jgi:hypothetical protein
MDFFWLVIIFIVAILADIFIIRVWRRYNRTKQESIQDGKTISRGNLMKQSVLNELNEYGFIIWIKKINPSVFEWLIILLVAWFYSGALLDFDSNILQQSGEHNESAIRPILADYGLRKHGEIPLWNHFMQTGFPHAGDLLNHFWSPIATLPVLIWGAINGMKVSIFISFVLAGLGQWYFSKVIGIKGIFRIWSAIMFMLSGGLALLWRVGWYELLVGMAWFPWTFASFFQALNKKTISSMAWSAFCASMVLFTGGGYYPFYLAGGVFIILAGMILTKKQQALMITSRSIIIAIMVIGLTAVMTLPIYDGYRLISREPIDDLQQFGSQKIHYALINYMISDPNWFNSNLMGAQNGWNWYYIGPLAIGAFVFSSFALRYPKQRARLLIALAMFTFYLLWSTNRFSIFKYIYDFWPFLYKLRFPNRLLIVATSPLLIISAYCLQSLFASARTWGNKYQLSLSSGRKTSKTLFSLRTAISMIMLVTLYMSANDVYEANQSVAFAPRPLDKQSYQALSWLKAYDPELYYIQLGNGNIWWHWLPAAYEMELPVINFVYSQTLATKQTQNLPESLFLVKPKYMISSLQEPPENGILIRQFEDTAIWEIPGSLPYAFSIRKTDLAKLNTTDNPTVTMQTVRLDGPNRIIVQSQPDTTQDTLILLVSNYPGWKLFIDGQPANISPLNEYLSTKLLPGKHTYLFIFDPILYHIGLVISITTIIILTLLIVYEKTQWHTLTSRLLSRANNSTK